MANLRIDIASEFTGRRAFQQAESSTNSLDKAVDKLGKRLAGAFSAYKVAEFAKASVKAFAEDAKAAAVLAKTLENVNQGYATDMVNNYIAKTEALYGVLDDKLRPAFSSLVVATGDATKSQALLQTALDVSAGTGKDLESVTAALSKAYLGNTTALARLGAGLSAADLKGKNFNDIITLLNQNFSGAAATAAETYGGKLDRINVAFANMQETIGKGIIDAFSQLDSSSGFNGVIDKMGELATYVSNVVLGLGIIASKVQAVLKPLGGLGGSTLKTLIFGPVASITDALASLGSKKNVSSGMPSGIANFLGDMNKIAAATAKINGTTKQLVTNNKALTQQQKDQLALKKASLEVDKALGIFNLEKIELAAASMNKQTAEDYARIKLKQDIIALQEAINAGDAKAATELAKVVEEDYKRVWAYQAQNIALGIQNGTIQNIQNAAKLIPQDMNLVNLANLKSALDYINEMLAKLANMPKTGTNGNSSNATGTSTPVTIPPVVVIPSNYIQGGTQGAGTGSTQVPFGTFIPPAPDANVFTSVPMGMDNPNLYGAGKIPQAAVTVNIAGDLQKLIDSITFETQNASANGTPISLTRNATNLAW